MRKLIIDPGHVGGSIFDLRDLEVDGSSFREGDFSFAWAESLSQSLCSNSFNCLLTRCEGKRARDISTNEMEHRCEELLSEHKTLERVLKFFNLPQILYRLYSMEELLQAAIYNELDLFHRIEIINKSDADLVLSLHLNGDPEHMITQRNGICAYTNKHSEPQWVLFQNIVHQLSLETNLPIYQESRQEMSLISKGLYLVPYLKLLKFSNKPILLIEGPFQNNLSEVRLLREALSDWTTTGSSTGRLAELTDGILRGLVA